MVVPHICLCCVLDVFILIIGYKHRTYRIAWGVWGNSALRLSVPLAGAPPVGPDQAGAMVADFDDDFDTRCLTSPSVCTGLLLAVATRAAHSSCNKSGKAQHLNDVNAWGRLLSGFLEKLPQTFDVQLRVDVNPSRFLYTTTTVGRSPCTVHEQKTDATDPTPE